ncbi:MAG: SGNH/GDSL hydrolase family protein, partial [Phycisphaerales bacterium]
MSIHQQQVAASAKPARKTVIAALACLAFAAVGGELLLRTFVPGLGMRRYDEHFTGSRALEINQRGFRGPIPSLEAPGLVLCLGDSTTYGTGTAASDTWPMLIGAAPPNSNRLAGINAAMPGTDLSQLTRSLDENWSDLRPDCVVVALSGNMASLAWIRREESSSIKTHEIQKTENSPPSLSRRARHVVSDSTLVGGLLWIAESLGYLLGVNHHRIDPRSPYGALIAQGWTQAGLDPTLADQCWD